MSFRNCDNKGDRTPTKRNILTFFSVAEVVFPDNLEGLRAKVVGKYSVGVSFFKRVSYW